MVDVACGTPLRSGIQIVVRIKLDYVIRATQ